MQEAAAPKVSFVSLGCPKALVDSERIITRLRAEGYELARKHDGLVLGVSDEDVFAAQRTMLREEGIYAEPAGAAALAGYRQAIQSGAVGENESVVCLVTGHGFKDPASIQLAAAGMESPVVEGAHVLRELRKIVEASWN